MATDITDRPAEPLPASFDDDKVVQYINIKLAALGHPTFGNADSRLVDIASPLLRNHQEKNRLLLNYACPADRRVNDFLNDYLQGSLSQAFRLPSNSFILDRPGLARTLSLPPNADTFHSDIVDSYRIKQGVLHNPRNDRRTTQGSFHICEGGLSIPDDKYAVPKVTFARLLEAALQPPSSLLELPFTSAQTDKARTWVSLLLRPIVCPAAGRLTGPKRMEIRFFAPGNLVSNLDFVESIFGNAGDPYLPENDAAFDVDGWTGHTGCVILAPHLTKLKKKDLGLPSEAQATERQKRDGLFWRSPDELYNGGGAFKITCRDARGVMVTIIADNYFGYCKKEVKTQISFSANLYGLSEEEHAGGAIAFPSYVLGREFYPESITIGQNDRSFADALQLLGERAVVQPEGHAVDRRFDSVVYVPENARFSVRNRAITFSIDGQERVIPLLAFRTYLLPSGYKIRMQKQFGGRAWRLVGTIGEGTLCHKPCTVSGGGKSEISKSIAYSMLQGPVFVRDFAKDFDEVAAILDRDFTRVFRDGIERPKRPLLSAERSLGSVIKLFTPSPEYTDEHNAWLTALPQTIRQLVFVLKRYYKPEWGDAWRGHFSVDRINGYLGHELKYDDIRLVANYLRVGHDADGSWRIYKVRTDFNPADKVQVEDDITASVVAPVSALDLYGAPVAGSSVKLVANCESMLFQRPDDAVIRGYDHQAEVDLSTPDSFLSNFQPLTEKDAREFVDDIVHFEDYTAPMRNLIADFAKDPRPTYFVSSAHPRLVDGKPSKNPRYLQRRPDLVNARDTYVAEMGLRLSRGVPSEKPVYLPVNAVLAGRRNNPRDTENGIPPLAVYSPIHYQELPELFMDFISSLTGKSPSTTGFGSEGALTKGPFNALWPVVDLNNALVSFIVAGYDGFTTAAGYVGPKIRVDHDVSLLIPELWCRMKPSERDAAFLIKNGYLEKLDDFEHGGRRVPASRLGHRITYRFVDVFLGRVFETPNAVFPEEMLKPEKQDLASFVDGVIAIEETHRRVAGYYFNDGSVEAACPPLKALLHIMAKGHFEGKGLTDPAVRGLFTRESVLSSAWYRERLETRRDREMALLNQHVKYLEDYIARPGNGETVSRLDLADRLNRTRRRLLEAGSPASLASLAGTIGADPFRLQI